MTEENFDDYNDGCKDNYDNNHGNIIISNIVYISRDLLFIVYISLKAFKNIDHDKTDESINKLQRLEDGRCLLVQKKEIVQMC